MVDRTVYVSGQLGMDPASGQLVQGGVQAQTRQVTPHKTNHEHCTIGNHLNYCQMLVIRVFMGCEYNQ